MERWWVGARVLMLAGDGRRASGRQCRGEGAGEPAGDEVAAMTECFALMISVV